MKRGYTHNSNHFTGKKKGIKTVMNKKKAKQTKTHKNKYSNQHDNIVYVEENNREEPAAAYGVEEKEAGAEETETNTSFSCPEFLHPDILREVIKDKFSLYYDCSSEDVTKIASALYNIDAASSNEEHLEEIATILEIFARSPKNLPVMNAVDVLDKLAYNIYWESIFLSETSAYLSVKEWISLTIKKGLGELGEKTKEIPFASYQKNQIRREYQSIIAAEKLKGTKTFDDLVPFVDMTTNFYDIAIPDIIGVDPKTGVIGTKIIHKTDVIRFVTCILEINYQTGVESQLAKLTDAAKIIYNPSTDHSYVCLMDQVAYTMYCYSTADYLTNGEKRSLICLSLIIKSIISQYQQSDLLTNRIPMDDVRKERMFIKLISEDKIPFRPYAYRKKS